MKVAVYTIALNEAAHVDRWANSALDADYRIVADTGSTDGTVDLLRAAGVTVHQIAIRPWRFDDARNAAMALIPDDVDVCCTMDMDEFLEPGWRPKLEEAWSEGTAALMCSLAKRSSLEDPSPSVWSAKKFHARWGYRTRRAVHEALFFTGPDEVLRFRDDIVIHHIQDHSKPRSQYLPLMEVAHREDPEDSQICFWLARDLYWAKEHEKAKALFETYLSLRKSTWQDERAEAMRFLAKIDRENAARWLDKARTEAPHRREIWADLAELLHDKADWLNLFWACSNGIESTRRTGTYLDDGRAWGFRLYDLGAIACWRLGLIDRAVSWGEKALELDPGNERLGHNLDFFRSLRPG